MAEQNRSSAAAGVGGLASEVNPHLVDEAMSLTNMYQELIDKEEELGGAKNLLSLSKKSSSLKKTMKQPKPPHLQKRIMFSLIDNIIRKKMLPIETPS